MAELMRTDVMIVVAVMALVTILLRSAGFWLMGFVPVTPRIKRMLDALPGSIIAAAVLPVVVQGGAVAALAVTSAMASMWLTRSDFVAVITGMGVAAAARYFGLPG
ncbi:branched-chain amino acid ABC transporter [Afipia sp. P52-10]|uniref:AzlD family protein n=1 Tax=Afipia sp. P52-10 TaxID=1429916 RepID=UPI0003DF0C9A|nr:AzlD domain-containing protein [Afipia sp. P52-10]ETR78479.1 branched-chain amino acid ABC transporter [Afipia sp. P52-10]